MSGVEIDRLLAALHRVPGPYELLEIRAYGCSTHDLVLLCATARTHVLRLLVRCAETSCCRDL